MPSRTETKKRDCGDGENDFSCGEYNSVILRRYKQTKWTTWGGPDTRRLRKMAGTENGTGTLHAEAVRCILPGNREMMMVIPEYFGCLISQLWAVGSNEFARNSAILWKGTRHENLMR